MCAACLSFHITDNLIIDCKDAHTHTLQVYTCLPIIQAIAEHTTSMRGD